MLAIVFFVVLLCPDRSFLIDPAGLTVDTARTFLIRSVLVSSGLFGPANASVHQRPLMMAPAADWCNAIGVRPLLSTSRAQSIQSDRNVR